MKKKWLALALSAAMVTGLAACGGGSSAPAPAAEPAGTESTVAAEPAGKEAPSCLSSHRWCLGWEGFFVSNSSREGPFVCMLST